jgi:choline dehydrogenase
MSFAGDERRSSYVAFIKPHLGRPNLAVETNTRVHRVVLDGDRRACGVEYERGGTLAFVGARREVLLCAGAIESPRLLMLSGIGPGPDLHAHSIPVVVDRPAVGANFQDHPNVTLFYTGKRDVDCAYPQLYGFHRADPDSDLPGDQADTCYVFYPARSSFREALLRLLPGRVLPMPLHAIAPVPAAVRAAIRLAFRLGPVRARVRRLYGLVVILGKPRSRGSVRLASARIEDDPLVDPAYLADPRDLRTMVLGVERARAIARAPALGEWGNLEVFPGARVHGPGALERFVRKNAMTTYHFAGSCRMGEDEDAVVDARLRVRGATGLRVADASVIPWVPVSALNAPSMLIGWRAARFVREEAGVTA